MKNYKEKEKKLDNVLEKLNSMSNDVAKTAESFFQKPLFPLIIDSSPN